ncbi:PREDICTED: uncharacterized protein LOC105460039 isoform X2 [Wasmannia auropunctata]|uniref:uncharacterized protein LOC105460039 isoform X2 n=1 Tax=Wasmannia auropunctata TaxID=64793 RepID=UPI0005EF627F|nr:PREDICTED: uncharacterized protein LOC105460039 isoform X2 [Wasmannia auropunctata]
MNRTLDEGKMRHDLSSLINGAFLVESTKTKRHCAFVTLLNCRKTVSHAMELYKKNQASRRVSIDVDGDCRGKITVSSEFHLKLSSRLKLLGQALGHRREVSTFGILR